MSHQCVFILNTTLKNGMDLDTTKKWVEEGAHCHVGTSKNIFVFLHGFGGSPYDVYPLANRLIELNETCLASVIIGQAQMKWDEPLVSADAIISHSGALLNQGLQLKSSGKRLVVVGFSMGGALSIIHAERIQPDAIILLAPYLGLKQGRWLFERLAQPLSKIIPVVPKLSEGRISSRAGAKVYKSGSRWLSIPAVFELQMIAAMAQKALPKITCPVLWCHAPRDPVADYELVLSKIPAHAKQVKCHRSQHVLLFDHDSDLIVSQVLEFIQEISTDPAVP